MIKPSKSKACFLSESKYYYYNYYDVRQGPPTTPARWSQPSAPTGGIGYNAQCISMHL